jgi:hypothetical protein
MALASKVPLLTIGWRIIGFGTSIPPRNGNWIADPPMTRKPELAGGRPEKAICGGAPAWEVPDPKILGIPLLPVMPPLIRCHSNVRWGLKFETLDTLWFSVRALSSLALPMV